MRMSMEVISFLLVLVPSALTRNAQYCNTIYVNSSSIINDSSCWVMGEAGSCSTLELGLQGLWTFSQNQTNCTLKITSGGYTLSQDMHTSYENVNGVSIVGFSETNGPSPTVEVTCTFKSGLSFIYSSNIHLRGIEFIGCGVLRNSTSNVNSSVYEYEVFLVGIYFLYCESVIIEDVVVRNATSTGIVFYNTVGENMIRNSNFSCNNYGNQSGGGGVYVEFSYCDPLHPDCIESGISNVDMPFTASSHFLFEGCLFDWNQANTSDFNQDTFILPHKQQHIAFGRGGGLSVFFKGNCSGNAVVVESSEFRHNTALWGGGLFAEFQDTAFNNSFVTRNCILENNSLWYDDQNHVGTGGGGARVGFIYFNDFEAMDNLIGFYDTSILGNIAYYGGGLSFYSAKVSKSNSNGLILDNCTVSWNSGRLGTGIDLSLWHPSINGNDCKILIRDCQFSHNTSPDTQSGGLVGIGSVYVDSIALNVSGNVSFFHNSGSALAATGTHIDIDDNSILKFYKNSGRNGGAIALLGNADVIVHENCSLSFIGNTAEFYGGAVYSNNPGEHDLVSSRWCFISYHNITVDSENWNASFYFEDNRISSTGEHNSIHATTLLPCLWGGPQGRANVDSSLSNVFCWNNESWVYFQSGKRVLCKDEISTASATLNMTSLSYEAFPGKTFKLSLSVFDETDHDVTDKTVLIAQIMSGNATFRGSSKQGIYDYISHEQVDLLGQPGSDVTIQLETLDPIVTVVNNIIVHLRDCPPGFIVDAKSNRTKCDCHGKNIFNNIVTCEDGDNFTSTISPSAWIGYWPNMNNSDQVVGWSPYVKISKENQKNISVDLSKVNSDPAELDLFFCNESKRTGILCGSCQTNFGVAIYPGNYDCIECPRAQWPEYVALEFIPVTIFFASITLASMSISFGPLNSYIFFAQVMATVVKLDAGGIINIQSVACSFPQIQKAYETVYDMWNMNIFHPFFPQICLGTNTHILTILSLGYLTAVYPLILLVLFLLVVLMYDRGVIPVRVVLQPVHYCLARTRQWWDLRQSIAGGFAVFITISYTKFCLVSMKLLIPTPLYDKDGMTIDSVYYYNGSTQYLKSESIPYVIVASVVLTTFVLLPPVLLMVPSVLTFASRLRMCHFLHHVQPWGRLHHFMEFFHGCFKDGTDGGIDCRFFASLYFVLRIVPFGIIAFFGTWQDRYTAQLVFYLIAALLFSIFRPYKMAWINHVDTSMFLLLATITCLSMLNLFRTRIGQLPSLFIFSVQCIMVFLPLVYCIGYFLFLFLSSRVKLLCLRIKDRERANLAVESDTNEEESIVQSLDVQNFLDFTDKSGRLNRPMRLTDSRQWRPKSVNDSRQGGTASFAINERQSLLSSGKGNSPNPSSDRVHSYGSTHRTAEATTTFTESNEVEEVDSA